MPRSSDDRGPRPFASRERRCSRGSPSNKRPVHDAGRIERAKLAAQAQLLNLRRLQAGKALQIQDFLTGRPSCGAKFSGPQISLFA